MDSPATTALTEAMWSGFKAADNCYADESMDGIDTGGNYESFSMGQVAAHVLQALEAAGFTVAQLQREWTWSWPEQLTGTGSPGYGYGVGSREEAEAEADPYMTIVTRLVGPWQEEQK